MGVFAKSSPATFRRAFFFCLVAVGAAFAAPTGSAPPPLAQTGKPDAAETQRILEQFRQAGLVGYFEFEVRALPRRGEEKVYQGRLWGGFTPQGAVLRVEITDAAGAVNRFLLQNGENATVWRVANGQVVQVDGAALFAPLIPGIEITAFDLQRPYLYWPGARVDAIVRMLGRPAYAFVFTPPPAFAQRNPQLKAVRAYFDTQYSAPVQTELIDPRQVMKTMSLVDLKKVGDKFIPKSIDLRNDLTRDKTRFQVTGAATDLTFPAGVFSPAALAEEVRPPAADKIVSIER